ncbi:small GTP-binding protein [Tritrichomonas foetus]|uniref:Small GTP-binding protein n=1 Tax=Tritrichomonas foetus TaxID=1144522 RepID=A0A1J4JH35_9EUKA|nr:small GTP-binding protein [Tritrichomonas foetus]|eukprot:OHS98017.1 small GTP-binding protein [Tritrichomonas foetus]
MKSSTPKKYSIKVVLVGSSGVGKTSLVNAFFDNPFESQALPTVAPASCSYTVILPDEVHVELQIWDTAGQERFQSISHMFYRESHVAFICYDVPNASSVESWIHRVRQEVPECLIFLVITKTDLLNDEQIQNVEREAEENLTKFNAKSIFLTSASSGTGIKDLFNAAAACYNQVYISNQPTLEINVRTGKSNKCC